MPQRAVQRRYDSFERVNVSRNVGLVSVFAFLFIVVTIVGLWFYLAFPKSYGQAQAAICIEEPAYPETALTDAHRMTLTEKEQAAYDKAESAIRHLAEGCDFPEDLSYAEVDRVYNAILNDHPDIFWLDVGYAVQPSFDGVSGMTFHYLYPDTQLIADKHAEYIGKAQELAEQFHYYADEEGETDEVYLARQAYNWVALVLDYDTNIYDQTVSAFFEEEGNDAVCAGYARSYQLLCDMMGIPCVYVTGTTNHSRDSSHAWNVCVLRGTLFYVDATWGDIGNTVATRDEYFTDDADGFAAEHTPDNPQVTDALQI